MYSNPNKGAANIPNLTGKLEFMINNSDKEELNIQINDENIITSENKIIHYLNLNPAGGTISVDFLPVCSPNDSNVPNCRYFRKYFNCKR